jgi:DNA-binding CsgD family transcriptional regulator
MEQAAVSRVSEDDLHSRAGGAPRARTSSLRVVPPLSSDGAQDQQALRRAAIAASRASDSPWASDGDVTDLLCGLVEGIWSLVDQFDADGEHFIVARRNTVAAAEPRRLTEREQQVVALAATAASNKQIAYALGISVPSVATHVASGLRKLGLRNRAQFVSIFSPRGGRRC